jgi:hypothetical protein
MRALLLAASLAGVLGSVLLISAAYAADPAKPYLGMSKEAIIACAGEPYAKYKSGAEAETLTYHYSGAGPVPAPPGEKKKEGGLAEFFPGGDKADKTEKKDKKDKAGDAGDAADASDASDATSDTSQKRAEGSGNKGKKDKASDATSDPSQKRAKGSGKKGKKGKKKDGGWTCTASLVFENGRLARVSFAHKDVRSPYDWQKEKNPQKQEEMRNAPLPTCTFSLPNCHRAQ